MLEELIYMILRGIIIGIVVSAPMGPVGIFCIQRTLDKGRKSGFFTGVGAAISDFIYCILTGFCLSFIEEFISSHRSPIQILGSSVLIGFGIWLIKKKPDSTVSADVEKTYPSVEGDIIKGFALTFSNPLILFLIIGLFAQFNFVIEGMTIWHYMIGFIGIIAGALGWWWIVTFIVDKVRGHFNQRIMKIINTVVGVIILIFAAFGIFSATSAYANGAEVGGRHTMTASFRVADKAVKGWQAELSDSAGRGFKMLVEPTCVKNAFGDSNQDVVIVRIIGLKSGLEKVETMLSDNIDLYKGFNSWRLMRDGNTWRVYAGNREYRYVCKFDSEMSDSGAPEIMELPGGKINVQLMSIDREEAATMPEICDNIDEVLQSYAGDKTGISGVYSLFDYDIDDSYAKSGGNYRLGILPSGIDGEYDMWYLSGAVTYSNLWEKGMSKGFLKSSPFSNIYEVEWRDAEGRMMSHDIQASYDPLTQLISIQFPYQNATLRFRKEP